MEDLMIAVHALEQAVITIGFVLAGCMAMGAVLWAFMQGTDNR
jgi:hypothetical protein